MPKPDDENEKIDISESVDPIRLEQIRSFDEREYRARREASLRLFVLLVISLGGLSLIGVSAYLALLGYNNTTTLMMFLFSGMFLLIIGVAAVLGVGVFRSDLKRDHDKIVPRSTYFEERDRK